MRSCGDDYFVLDFALFPGLLMKNNTSWNSDINPLRCFINAIKTPYDRNTRLVKMSGDIEDIEDKIIISNQISY